MQFTDVLCYFIFMITVFASHLEAADQQAKDIKQLQSESRISKREATILMGYPLEPNLIFQKPKVIYRRISQAQRYIPPTVRKFRSTKPRNKAYKPSKINRKPNKNYGSHKNKRLSSKQAFKSYKPKWYRNPSPMYGPSSFKPRRNPELSFKGKMQFHGHTGPDNTGFGEPPSNFDSNYNPKKQSYGEPPIDSYGAPTKVTKNKVVPQGFKESNIQYGKDKERNKLSSWEFNRDNSAAYSKQKPAFAKPEPEELFATATAQDYNDDIEDMYQSNMSDKKYYKKRKPNIVDNSKVVKNAWHVHKRPDLDEDDIIAHRNRFNYDKDVIVGGQYAEPPARYVARFEPSAPMFKEDENTFLPVRDVNDHAMASSVSISPYVNYKNSNLAFSPQNLNDAFSIVDS